MKPTAKSPPERAPLLVFGAHPDDVEFGCGGIVAKETASGRTVHLVLCSRGESASRGTPSQRAAEAKAAARILGASIEFVLLDGDAALAPSPRNARRLAAVIRRQRPALILAPTDVLSQHPDHYNLAQVVADAARLARYGGVAALRRQPAHAVGSLLHYAITAEAEPPGLPPVAIDISDAGVMERWTKAMRAHGSQMGTRNYLDLQLSRARVLGLRAGVEFAQALYPGDPLLFDSLEPLTRSARRF